MRSLLAILLFALLSLWPAAAQQWTQDASPIAATYRLPELPEGWVAVPGVHLQGYSDARDREALERLLAHADGAIPRIADQLAIPMGHRMNLYLADSERRFHSLQPGEAPDWADGTAWPQRGLIFLKSPRIRPGTATPLHQVLDHEIVHVLLGQAFGPKPVPRWLQEGMAQWVAGEYTPEVTERLARGMLGGGLLTLDDLTAGFPADPVRANLAYAQSADLIAFLSGEYGPEALQTIIHEMATGTPVRVAFRKATGVSPDEVDGEWRARLMESPIWLRPLTDSDSLWLVAAALMIAASLMVRRRNRRRLELWEQEELLQRSLEQTRIAPSSGWLN